jgi:phosphoglucomutase
MFNRYITDQGNNTETVNATSNLTEGVKMPIHKLAGKPAPEDLLTNIPRLVSAYYTRQPDPNETNQQVSFGTSGHRGTSMDGSFNEAHIVAICQAICEHRKSRQIDGPLFLGMDTHALSEAAFSTALEVLAATDVEVVIQEGLGFTPTPVISHAILTHNHGAGKGLADGIVITPSHNPPMDGGFKYNPPSAGPADDDTTRAIAQRANQILSSGYEKTKRISYQRALVANNIHTHDLMRPYIDDLQQVVGMQLISDAGLKLGVDPMGGAGTPFWLPIAERYNLSLEVVNEAIDPSFRFMTVDKDGKIRMDCSSSFAMQGLITHKDRFDIAFGNDPDGDRHGIVTRSSGLLNPNHYLAVAIWYLFQNRPQWGKTIAIGKTLVSTSMIDRVAEFLHRPLYEVPVGFKWFVEGLLSGTYGFGGEESAGASFLRHNGSVWTTDKDGLILNLLAAEIMAKTQKDPGEIYAELEHQFGASVYERMDAPATTHQKAVLKDLSPEDVEGDTLAGDPIVAKMTQAPGNDAPIGGLKVTTAQGWFAARPSGTEDIYKIYAESFKGPDHLANIQKEAQDMVSAAFQAAGL